ncbi:CapA family protein [Leucobacter weissii]|uniref:CapA family protein n=1 Tax=Leucobacter weissii TaxID=1983706 RepID=A0A939SBI0_9MICO|nr:CapA family protein [Leucobacter weissii]MBO1901393.1 CapA family protein [Leucobacter weissii]
MAPEQRARRRNRLIAILALGALVLSTVVVGAVLLLNGGRDAAPVSSAPIPSAPGAGEEPAPEPATEPEAEPPIRIAAMGDMLPHDSVNENARRSEGGYDYGRFFTGILPLLDDADAVFCNQEVPSAGADLGISGYPTFNAPAQFAKDLREEVGCDLINLANNHMADKGTAGIAATREVWDGLDPLSISGANRSAEEQSTIEYGEVRGVTTALVSFAEYSNAPVDGTSLNMMGDTALVERLIGEARERAELVLVSAHWGTEDSHEVNEQQRAFAQRVADLGADVVLGTGPHVLQPVEWLDREDGGRTLVWYSLGNMLSTQLALPQLTGVVASFEVVPGEGDEPATVSDPAAVLTYMHYEWSAEEEAAGDLLARRELSLTPLSTADDLLRQTRFGVSSADQIEAMTEILGSDVRVE